MCTVLLPPGVNPIAVNKYINTKILSTYCTPMGDTKKPQFHKFMPRIWKAFKREFDRCYRQNKTLKFRPEHRYYITPWLLHNNKSHLALLISTSQYSKTKSTVLVWCKMEQTTGQSLINVCVKTWTETISSLVLFIRRNFSDSWGQISYIQCTPALKTHT